MNIDDLKSNWQSLHFPPDYGGATGQEADIMTRMRAGRVSTLRNRLATISIILTAVCVAGILLMIPYVSATPTLAVLAMAFFVFIGSMHCRNYRRVMRLNFSLMTVREAMTAVCAIESSRLRLRAIGMALGLPLVFYMCFTFTEVYGHYVLYGCLCGAAIGLGFGLWINHRAVTIIREMRRQLS